MCGVYVLTGLFMSIAERFMKTEAAANPAVDIPQQESTEAKKDKWLSSFFVRRIDPGHESHSSKLSDKHVIYELQSMHSNRFEFMSFIMFVINF